jgi:hypothetical protein
MQIVIDLEIWFYVCVALADSLLINAVMLIKYLGKKFPHLIYKED